MRPTTPSSTLSLTALVLAATLALGACSTGEQGATTDGAVTTDAATGTEGAPDQAAATLDVEDLPDPVAEVNGEQIGKDQFVTAFESQLASARQQAQMTGMPLDETLLRDEVVDLLVDAELLHQEGERLDLGASEEEIDAELATLVESSGAGSTEELLALLREQGVEEEQVREELGRLLLIDQLIAERGGVEQPSEQELKDYYEQVTGQPADAAGAGEADDAGASADPAAAPPFEDVRDQVAEQLTQERENEVLTTLLEQLRADAEITSHV